MNVDTSVPSVVIGRGGTGDVSIARTLGRLGVRVHLVGMEGLSRPVWASRYWASRTQWDFARPEAESL